MKVMYQEKPITLTRQVFTQRLYLGIAIGGTKTSVTVGNKKGEIFYSVIFKTKATFHEVVEDIFTQIDKFIITAQIYIENPLSVLDAIGISSGGPLDPIKGTINSPPNLPTWDNVPIAKIFHDRYGMECYLENDANAGVLAEWMWGNGKGVDNLIYLTFGTGLGAGMILDGRLYCGTSFLAGEVGHIRMTGTGPTAYGKAGSWESYCSGTGISRLYEHLYGGKLLTAKQVCDLAEAGDKKACQVIELSSEYLGKGLALLIDILNPERIIIGSIFTRREKLFRKTMEQHLSVESLEETLNSCSIFPAGLGPQLDEKGALAIVVYNKKLKLEMSREAI